nr:MAG TPA: hypothetical protein [Caudoviricetes sp.]
MFLLGGLAVWRGVLLVHERFIVLSSSCFLLRYRVKKLWKKLVRSSK